MGHWHVGCNTPGIESESREECFADIREAGWAFRTTLQRAIDALPPESAVPGSDEQYLAHADWLGLRPGELLIGELVQQRRLEREVHDGRSRPTSYWVGEAEGNPGDCELQAGGGLR